MPKPLGKLCYIKYTKQAETKSGILIHERDRVKLNYPGEILALGSEVKDVEPNLKVGDKVVFRWHNNEDLGDDTTFVHVDELLVKVG